MDVSIRISDRNVDVKCSSMTLLAEMSPSYSDNKACCIQDIWSGGVGTSDHRKGIGTALVYYFLDFLVSEYGPDLVVKRTPIHHETGDSQDVCKARLSFWDKFGLYQSDTSTAGKCLADLASNNVTVDTQKFVLKVI
jgi:hypothetical protein